MDPSSGKHGHPGASGGAIPSKTSQPGPQANTHYGYGAINHDNSASSTSSQTHVSQEKPNTTEAQPYGVTILVGQLPSHKSLCEAYILWMPLGIIGLHHFYLRRYGFGILYFFTLGLCGVGWIVDLLRMPQLVRDVNERIDHPGEFEPLTKTDAYILWFPLGFLGLHHYYLRRPVWGVAYTFTAGFFGIGWLCDAVRIPSLVQDANDRLRRAREDQSPRNASLCDAYALGITPAGILGAHHFYLENYVFGLFYAFTLAVCGLGWVIDWFRMPWLVERANHPDRKLLGKRHKYVDDAYVMAVPFGILGAHHFYLERPGWGTLYLFTCGLGGIGWLIDLFRMPGLVRDTNVQLENEMKMTAEIRDQLRAPHCTVITTNEVIHASAGNGASAPQAPPLPTATESGVLRPPPYSNVPNYNSTGVNPEYFPPAYSNEGYDGQKI